MSDVIAPSLPSYRTLADLRGTLDVENIANIKVLFRQAINNSNDEHEERSGIFHPSSVDYCARANVMQYLREPATDRRSKEFIEIVTMGHMVHEHIQGKLEELVELVRLDVKRFKRATVEFQREVRYDPATDALYQDLNLGGTCDGLMRITTPIWEQYGVIEIKSQNTEYWTKIVGEKRAYKNHLMQSHLYAFRFQTPIIWVWYYNKNNSKHELKPHFFDHEIFDEAVEYFEKLNDAVRAGDLPERVNDWFECSECVYRTKCDPPVLRGKKKALKQITGKSFQRKKP